MPAQINIDELRKIFNKNTKSRKEVEYTKQITKARNKKAIKKATAPSDTELLQDSVKKKKISKQADSIVNPETPESGTEAIDRILKEIKTARGSVMSGDKPLYPGDYPEPMPDEQRYKTGWMQRWPIGSRGGTIDESKTPIPFESATGLYEKEAREGIPGTTSYIGGQRVKDLEGELSTAQSAKESGKSFPQEGMDEAVQAKYREYMELFDQPKVSTPYHNYGDSKVTSGGRGRYVPKEKSRHLAELATREWFKKTYGQ